MQTTTNNSLILPSAGLGFRINSQEPCKKKNPKIISVKGENPYLVKLVSNIKGERDFIEWEKSTDAEHWTNFTTTYNPVAYYCDLEPGKLYYFRVRVVRWAVAGEWSEVVAYLAQ